MLAWSSLFEAPPKKAKCFFFCFPSYFASSKFNRNAQYPVHRVKLSKSHKGHCKSIFHWSVSLFYTILVAKQPLRRKPKCCPLLFRTCESSGDPHCVWRDRRCESVTTDYRASPSRPDDDDEGNCPVEDTAGWSFVRRWSETDSRRIYCRPRIFTWNLMFTPGASKLFVRGPYKLLHNSSRAGHLA